MVILTKVCSQNIDQVHFNILMLMIHTNEVVLNSVSDK